MKKYCFFAIPILVVILAQCGPSVQVTDSWKNKSVDTNTKVYRRIYIAVITANPTVRTTLENDLAEAAAQNGYTPIKSSERFPMNFSNQQPPSNEEILAQVRETNADGIFTTALLKQETESRYVHGSTTYAPYPAYSYYGSFSNYYSHWYGPVYQPGYYTQDKVYYLESNLFDAQTQNILWSAQSQTYNPTKISSFSKKYTDVMIRQLVKDGVLRK
jgi:hypothetical protein